MTEQYLVAEPTDLELIRRISAAGGKKYTAGNIDHEKYRRLVALGWLTAVSVNVSDVLYEVTDAGKVAAHRVSPFCATPTRAEGG